MGAGDFHIDFKRIHGGHGICIGEGNVFVEHPGGDHFVYQLYHSDVGLSGKMGFELGTVVVKGAVERRHFKIFGATHVFGQAAHGVPALVAVDGKTGGRWRIGLAAIA